MVAAQAAKASADGFIYSERAWIMAELGWTDRLRVAVGSSQNQGEPRFETTTANLKVNFHNAGRSPAWIDNIYARMDIVDNVSVIDNPKEKQLRNYGPTGAVGPDEVNSFSLQLGCEGHTNPGEFLSVYVEIDYHDIFGLKRATSVGYDPQRFVIPTGRPARPEQKYVGHPKAQSFEILDRPTATDTADRSGCS